MDPEKISAILNAQIAAIVQAPVPYIVSMIVSGLLVWKAASNHFKVRIESAHARRMLAEEKSKDYERKLSGASPDEAREKLLQLELAVEALTPRQRKLSDDQKNIISQKIKGVKCEDWQLSIIYVASSHEAHLYALDLSEAFSLGGWKVWPDILINASWISSRGLCLASPAGREISEIAKHVVAAFDAAGVEYVREFLPIDADRLFVELPAPHPPHNNRQG